MDRPGQTTLAFAAREHRLHSCCLQPLRPDAAGTVAQQLAQLDPWLTLGYTAASLTGYLQRADCSLHSFLVSVSGQPAGIVCCRHPWLFGPFLELLAIYPPLQNRGLGREILDWLENQGTFANLWTTVSSFNQRGRNFYRKNGFQEVGPLPDLVRPGHTELLLRKIIRRTSP